MFKRFKTKKDRVPENLPIVPTASESLKVRKFNTARREFKRESLKSLRGLILLAGVLVLLGFGIYIWFQFGGSGLVGINETGDTEIRNLINRVGSLIVLPDDEEPTIATVSDEQVLQGQPFFEGAKKGDKVLIYSKAQKAILYDPLANKIINVAPINLDK